MHVSQRITRGSASNLALAFILLPKAKRRSMTALYAFCRQVDDVADEDQVPADQRRRTLQEWRTDVQAACDRGHPQLPVNQELQPVIEHYQLPFSLFDELIRGVEMDLDQQRYATASDLELYCYRVASVVGLLSIEIFGYRDPACRQYAVYLGKALQLTNILRDVFQDAQRGRIYLPQDCLRKHQVPETALLQGVYSEDYYRLAREIARQARKFFESARQTLPAAERHAMVAAELMGCVYWNLLLKLESIQFNVFQPRPVRLHKLHKLFLILTTWVHQRCGSKSPLYGGPGC
jgi:15-cis-phytoene synthase